MPNHRPVLLKEVLEYLQPKPRQSYLDVTAGWGGHAQAILDQTKQPEATVLVDRDADAVDYLRGRFEPLGVRIVHQDFLTASKLLANEGRRFDMILADLGISSPLLERAERGFSIKQPGPLDMRLDRRQDLTAGQVVNNASEAELTRIFSEYGQEPKAARIAKMIILARPIATTDRLAAIAAKAWPHGSRVHPTTRIFQALRIAVNDELDQLSQSLPIWLDLLATNGRLVVISFHSLEDRIVKHFFAEHSATTFEGELKVLTKKPVTPSNHEIVSNPRARSAKLRAAVKIKTKRKD